VVLGGGFAGLEAALSLRAKLPDASISLVSDRDYFLFTPNTIYIPFGLDAGKLAFHLAGPTRRRDIRLINATAREVDPISRQIYLDGPAQLDDLSYDYLVVATGAAMRGGEIPGLAEFGTTIWTTPELLSLRAGFRQLIADARKGGRSEVLFLVPPGNRYAGPLYEMAIMLDSWLKRKKVRDLIGITWATFEESYVQAYGPGLNDLVTAEFEHRGIAGYTGYRVDRVERGEAHFSNGARLPFSLLVSFPPHRASAHFTHLPSDDLGFIATDLTSRQVVGYPEVYAVGDASDYPAKQADLAFLQAGAAAAHIWARLLGREPALSFDPLSLPVSDGLSRAAEGPSLRTAVPAMPAMPAMPALSAALLPNMWDHYNVGTSPVWRPGKMALGIYLPWRFKAGNPFYSGAPWKGLEGGLRPVPGAQAP
jgi:NADH dehydrogenase FAD-containing subunit